MMWITIPASENHSSFVRSDFWGRRRAREMGEEEWMFWRRNGCSGRKMRRKRAVERKGEIK
jgi:hypothetical protein